MSKTNKNTNRARNLKVKLGFPQGISNPSVLKRQRDYQNAYRKSHKIEARITQAKFDKKCGSTRLQKYLFSLQQKQVKLKRRKEQAKDGIKELRQLQKLSPKNSHSKHSNKDA